MKQATTFISHNLCMLICMLIVVVPLSYLSERIFQNEGLGFDGVNYGDIITRYDGVVSGEVPMSPHLYLRFLPALAARWLMLRMGLPLDNAHVVLFFRIWNVVMLGFAVFAWGRVGDAAGLSSRGKWLGFSGLFVNYAVLKYSFYYPVLLDSTALALGVTLAWLYMARRLAWTLVVGIIGLFISPPVGLEGCLLFLFPRPRLGVLAPALAPRALQMLFAALTAGVVLGLLLPFVSQGVAPDMVPFQIPGKLLVVIYIFVTVFFLSQDGRFFRLSGWIESKGMAIRFAALALAIGGLLAAPALSPESKSPNWIILFHGYVVTVLYNAAVRPGEFLVAHTLYFGPAVLLGVCVFPRLCRAGRALGNGMVLMLAFGLLQFLNPLSRQMIGAVPFFILALCLALEPYRFPGWFLWAFVAVSLAVSKVWLRINAGADLGKSILEQPDVWRRYVSSTGNWMLTSDYLIQGGIVFGGLVVLSVVVFLLLRRSGLNRNRA